MKTAAAPAARPAPASAGVGMLENALGITVAVLSLLALVRVFLLQNLFGS
jgi:hypothetical protein